MTDTESITNLAGLNQQAMKDFFLQLGEKPFRASQILKWIHQKGVTEFDSMTDISKSLREKLKVVATVELPEITDEFKSVDGSYKWIVKVASGSHVEMVYIPEAGRGTLCISSQAGCILDCSFCATGKQGFNSNLSVAEVIGQLWWANKKLNAYEPQLPGEKKSRVITNVVMMGMGEPLLNFENVMSAVDLMMDDLAYGLSKRRVTISTSGVVPAIEKMKDFTDASIAVSLHAPNDELRSQLVPINKKYPIAQLLQSVRNYMDSLSDRRVPVIEYTLISGINDHRQHARDLATLLEQFPCKINLIPFNPFSLSDYERPSSTSVSNFRQILQKAGYTVTVRTTRADDIAAACGQLVGQVNDKTSRSARHKKTFDENLKATGNFTRTDNIAIMVDRP